MYSFAQKTVSKAGNTEVKLKTIHKYTFIYFLLWLCEKAVKYFRSTVIYMKHAVRGPKLWHHTKVFPLLITTLNSWKIISKLKLEFLPSTEPQERKVMQLQSSLSGVSNAEKAHNSTQVSNIGKRINQTIFTHSLQLYVWWALFHISVFFFILH